MADIELNNLREDGREEDAREEGTSFSFTENTNNANTEFDTYGLKLTQGQLSDKSGKTQTWIHLKV